MSNYFTSLPITFNSIISLAVSGVGCRKPLGIHYRNAFGFLLISPTEPEAFSSCNIVINSYSSSFLGHNALSRILSTIKPLSCCFAIQLIATNRHCSNWGRGHIKQCNKKSPPVEQELISFGGYLQTRLRNSCSTNELISEITSSKTFKMSNAIISMAY